MSFVKDLLGGSSGAPATVQDVRSPENIQLGGMSNALLMQMLMQGREHPAFATAPGPNVAPVTGGEQDMMNMIRGHFGIDAGGGLMDLGGNEIMRQITGGTSRAADQMPQVESLMQQILSGQTMDPASNPALASSIEAAQRPLIEQFGDVMGDMRGDFTKAGHFVQPGSSSPFETAKGRTQTGLANAMGDVSSRMVMDNMNMERARQSGVMDSVMKAFETGQDRQLTAAASTAPFTSSQLNQMMSGLQAEALPRLVEQHGITEGTRQYENQQQQLLQALQLAFQNTGTPHAVSLPGSQGSPGMLQGMASGFGNAFGGNIGDWAGSLFGGGSGGGGGGLGGMFSSFLGGGGGTGAATSGGWASSLGGGGMQAGGSAASGGGGLMSGAGALAANPFTWLAAAIAGNEISARDAGRRNEDPMKHFQDMLTGKVLEQDMDYYGDKVGGIGGNILRIGGKMGHPEGIWDTLRGLF